MASKIDGSTIYLTRGDTLLCQVTIYDGETEYSPVDGDRVVFTLKNKAIKSDRSGFVDEEPLLEVEVPVDSMVLRLEPEDTESLAFREYVYDMVIEMASGRVDTFIPASPFYVMEEVHE